MSFRFAFAVAILSVVAFTAGLLMPSPAVAAVSIDVDNHPGGNYDYMTCGWHGACGSTPTAGSGIDWRNFGTNDVWWRSRSYRSDTSAAVGDIFPSSNNGTCKSVKVDMKDIFGFAVGAIRYVHSESAVTGAKQINGSPGGTFQEIKVSKTASNELQACLDAKLWTAAHNHQVDAGGFGWDFGNYDSAVNAGAQGDTTAVGMRQYSVHYTE